MTVHNELPTALLRFNEPDSIDVARGVEINELKLRDLIATEAPMPNGPRGRRPGRIFAVAGALACVLLLAGVVVGIRGGLSGPPADAGPLAAVAERVSLLPDPAAMKSSDSLYTDLRSFSQMWVDPKQLMEHEPGQKGWVQFSNARLETWLTSSGGIRTRATPKQFVNEYPTEQDRKNAESVKSGISMGVSLPLVDDTHPDRVFTVGDEHLDYEGLTRLPSDPVELKKFIRSTVRYPSSAGPSADEMRAATALLGYPLRSSVRAAIFTVMAGLPGITVKSGVEDALGRTGDSVSWYDKPYRKELIFDPQTGVELEESLYLLEPELDGIDSRLRPGTLTSRETVAARGVVSDPHGTVDPIDYAGPVHSSTDR